MRDISCHLQGGERRSETKAPIPSSTRTFSNAPRCPAFPAQPVGIQHKQPQLLARAGKSTPIPTPAGEKYDVFPYLERSLYQNRFLVLFLI